MFNAGQTNQPGRKGKRTKAHTRQSTVVDSEQERFCVYNRLVEPGFGNACYFA